MPLARKIEYLSLENWSILDLEHEICKISLEYLVVPENNICLGEKQNQHYGGDLSKEHRSQLK